MFHIFSRDAELLAQGASEYQLAGPAWFYKWLGPGKYDTSQIDSGVLLSMVEKHGKSQLPLILDIEEFDLYANRQHAVAQMQIAAEAWISVGRRVGWYGYIPEQEGKYWVAAEPHREQANAEWRKLNDSNYADLLGDKLSFLCPSLYAFYKPGHAAFGSWANCASGMIREAERLGKGKPVYPFLWPMYHPSIGGGSIDLEEWQAMVEHVASFPCVKGIVAWQEAKDSPVDRWRDVLIRVKKQRDKKMAIEEIESKVSQLKTEHADFTAATEEAAKQKAELTAAIDAAIEELQAMKRTLA